MTLTEYNARSVADARVVSQIDIAALNRQWVNAGAGIWKINVDGLYPETDATLLDGFSAQSFGDIGSMTVDGILQTRSASLLLMTGDEETWYFDAVLNDLYVCFVGFGEPFFHNVYLGITRGFSFDEFTPEGAASLYQGRLLGSPQIGQSRDPLFWGKIQYTFGGIDLVNSDGAYDTFAEDNYCYGNEARFYFGYLQLDIGDYARIHTGVIQDLSISEEQMSIAVSDKRIQLTRPIQYQCTNLNALDAIVEILQQSYNIFYNDTYYDTTAWAAAQALVPVVTIDMHEESPTIDVIEEICGSTFALFKIEPDNRFSAKVVDTTASAATMIVAADILNHHSVGYKVSEVISSVKVGYDKRWDSDYVSPYTFLTDTSREDDIFLRYKTYNQKTFYTLLTNSTDAQAFADTIMDYAQDVHGMGELTVPMKYYAYGVGDILNAEINREGTTMLGTKKIELLSKRYNLRDTNITFGYRIV